MAVLWSPDDLVEATGGAMHAAFAASGVSIDTRTLRPGDLFVALHGESAGRARLRRRRAGARAPAARWWHDMPESVAADAPLLVVDDTLAALHRLGGFARARFAGRRGRGHRRVGKTTTKEMLRTILAVQGADPCRRGLLQQPLGRAADAGPPAGRRALCVAEIGMNHAGEIAPLARLARPHVAVITAIEKAHVGHLGSIEAIADEKASILRRAGAGRSGGAAGRFAAARPAAAHAPARPRVLTFGAGAGADVRLAAPRTDADGTDVTADRWAGRCGSGWRRPAGTWR